jgi:cytochrome P450
MQTLTMEIIGRLLFGSSLGCDAEDIRRAMTVAAATLDPLLSLLAPKRLLRSASCDLRSLIDREIDERCASGKPGDDVLTLLRSAEGSNGRPASPQLRDDVLTLFVAGHDTIANALVWTWHALATHAEVEARLHRELCDVLGERPATFDDMRGLTYTTFVFMEALRLYPPAWLLTRCALEDHEVHGVSIPKGSIVVMSQYLLHRDARFFSEPRAFRPERWAGEPARGGRLAYFPFGAGPRSCIGQGLAMIEGPLVLATLAARWRCRPLAAIEPDPRATLRPRAPALAQVLAVRHTR